MSLDNCQVCEVPLTLEPMDVEAVDTLPPASKGGQYELKVDGFRYRRSKLMLKTPARRA
jgi:hypothetical protein